MQLSQKNRIAIVIPWFGKDVPGGAENATKSLIEHLSPYFDIEVLTTCVENFHSDWNDNFWKEGEYFELGITVRRFKVRKRDVLRFDDVNAKLMRGEKISTDEEKVFIEESIRSDDLTGFIHDNLSDYKWIIAIPYMFGTTYDSILEASNKSILIPCLHDESYAYLNIYKKMFSASQKILFLTNTEMDFAKKLFSSEVLKFNYVGLGLDVNVHADKGKFKKKYNFDNFVLCAGRKDVTKNTPELIEFFDRYVRETDRDIKLVLIGPGKLSLFDNPQIIDLGFVSKEDQYNAMTDCLFLCNPSHNESFSIVIMESWLCNRPVLVSESCAVTRDHVVLSNGGLFYKDYNVFKECLDYFLNHKFESDIMGQNGRKYVLDNFSWEKVTQQYLNVLND
ncbi:MAG: glycosyltransferase family 4 protein [Clostridia bacterium]|nr:glycosyltransferase family 4 protein [Clostridia bacterium]